MKRKLIIGSLATLLDVERRVQTGRWVVQWLSVLCAVNLVRAGVPLPDVGRWLGHSPNSITVTMRYARHAPKDAAQVARGLLEARIAAS